jgi:hypothetical protein
MYFAELCIFSKILRFRKRNPWNSGHSYESDVSLELLISQWKLLTDFLHPSIRHSPVKIHTTSPTKKLKTVQSAGKALLTALCVVQGILLLEFLDHGTTVMQTTRAPHWDIWVKHHSWLTEEEIPHDSACTNTVFVIIWLLEQFHWECLAYPPYSQDIAPSDQ